MSHLSIPTRTGFRSIAAALLSTSIVLASPPEALLLKPIPVRPVFPKTYNRCLAAIPEETLLSRLSIGAEAARVLRLDSLGNSLLRLKVDTSDGLCDLGLEFQDSLGQASSRIALPDDKPTTIGDGLERLVIQLSLTLRKERAATLDLATTPAGATVHLAGEEAGKTPLHLESLAAGAIPLVVALPGWTSVSETLVVKPGQNLNIVRQLSRSQAWLDSARNFQISFRRDSVWNAARSTPAKDLADLYDRLAIPVAPGARAPVAILPFDVTGARDSSYDPGLMAAEYGVSRWSGDPRFVLVERTGVSKLLTEQAFAQSGAVSDSDAAKMGRLAAARYLVTGTVQVADGKQVFAARLVSVETGEIVSAAVTEKSGQDMEALYREALGEKGQMSASIYRSLVGPGWGQFYTGHPVQGGVALGAVIGAIGFATWAWIDYADKDDQLQKYRKHDPSTLNGVASGDEWLDDAEAARADRNDAGIMLGISLGVVGAVWAINVVDAAILGHLESRRIRARYYGGIPVPVVRPDGLALAWRF